MPNILKLSFSSAKERNLDIFIVFLKFTKIARVKKKIYLDKIIFFVQYNEQILTSFDKILQKKSTKFGFFFFKFVSIHNDVVGKKIVFSLKLVTVKN